MAYLRCCQEKILRQVLESYPSKKVIDLGGDSRTNITKIISALSLDNLLINQNNFGDFSIDLEEANLSHICSDYNPDTICAFNLFEHVFTAPQLVDSLLVMLSKRKVRKVIFSTPFLFRKHPCPFDYLRFTDQFYDKAIYSSDLSDNITVEKFVIGGSVIEFFIDYVFTFV